jgi:hypothetical protein
VLTSEILISTPKNLTEVEQKSGTFVFQLHTSKKARKYKGKIFLLFITHNVMTAYEEQEVRLHVFFFLNSAILASKWLASCIGRLLPEKGAPVLTEQGNGWYPDLV